ncbi:hypothetical protein F5Y15DRAFT_342769 [Xylariaceae sp. FL0016]|nr:hypothetical protein F5Y15DRAFT_342769 [Xylariaceae sp. FL0016]
MAFIRPYQDSDFEACANICIATLPPSLQHSPDIPPLTPYLWAHPYTHLSPRTAHVLDDGRGAAVGYCIGCPDVHAFVRRYPSYAASVLAQDVPAPPQLETREPWLVEPAGAPVLSSSMGGEEVGAGEGTKGGGGDEGEGEVEQQGGRRHMIVNPQALAQLAYRPDWALLDGKEHLHSRWRATMHIDLLPAFQSQGWGRLLISKFITSVRESGEDFGEGVHIGVAGENGKVVGFYEKLGFRVMEAAEAGRGFTLVKDFEKT